MRSNDRAEFVRMLNGLAAMKPGAKLTPESIELWWASMQDWSIADFKAAASHLAKSSEFMPSPFHFEQLRKAGRPDAAEAWEQARRFASTLWHPLGYRNGSIGDRAIDLAVGALGGYPAIAMCDTDKLQWLEKRFHEAFEDTSEKHSVREAIPAIAQEHAQALADLNTPRSSGFARIGAPATAPARALPAPKVVPAAPKVAAAPAKSAREKIIVLLPLQMDDEAIAKVAGEPVELVRQVRAEEAA